MKLKKIIVVLIFLLIVAGIVFYFLFFKGIHNPTPTGQTGSLPGATTTTQFPGNGSGQNGKNGGSGDVSTSSSPTFGIVSNDPALAYFVDGGNVATLIEPAGPIESIAGGQTTVISSSTILNLASASFSYDGKKIMAVIGAGADAQTRIFDIASKTWLSLPQGMQDPTWSPNDYRIAYLSASGAGTETLSTATITGTSVKTATIQAFAMEDSSLQWPTKNILIISDRPSAFTVGSALSFDISAKTITPLVVEYPGLTSVWSDAAPITGLVFSGNTGYQGGTLSLMGGMGGQKTLSFMTLPSKCTFNNDVATSTQTVAAPSSAKTRSSSTTNSSTTLITLVTSTTTLDLYCAVPRDQDTMGVARLPDEYDQKMFFTADDFYKITVVSGTLSTVFSDTNQTLDATSMKVANNILFFINRYDQKLYAIKLGSSE